MLLLGVRQVFIRGALNIQCEATGGSRGLVVLPSNRERVPHHRSTPCEASPVMGDRSDDLDDGIVWVDWILWERNTKVHTTGRVLIGRITYSSALVTVDLRVGSKSYKRVKRRSTQHL